MNAEPVKLLIANQKACLWDLNDIQKLRVQHHICGVLSGTLPQVTQQNVFLGLPLVLLPEEVVLLVRNKLAILVNDPSAHLPPTLAESTSYSTSRASAITAQQEASRLNDLERKREFEAKNRDKIEKKRAEKEKKRKEREDQIRKDGLEVFVPDLAQGAENTGAPAAAASAGASSAPSPLPVASPSQKSTLASATEPPLHLAPYTILIEPTSSPFAWYDPSAEAVSYPTLESAKKAGIWNYPLNPVQDARCKVFEDLWRRGFYMGGGLRFGGDFLVYPGDPLRYHSHFTLTVLSTPSTSIMPLDLVAYGRLATAVKKAHLLATWNEAAKEGEGEAEYVSLEWAAFG
ncbi:hypothetical protein JCM11641_003777 [Rhodosporidiobolus odoratus]